MTRKYLRIWNEIASFILIAAIPFVTSCGTPLNFPSAVTTAAGNPTGGGPAASTRPAKVCTICKMFVTSPFLANSGNFGATAAQALVGVDAYCMADTNKPAGGGTYKAMFGTSLRRACTSANCSSGGVSENTSDWVLYPNTAYYRADGTTVIGTTTAAGIFNIPLSNSINASTTQTITGLDPNWTLAAQGTCNDLTGGGTTNRGDDGATDNTSLFNGSGSCNKHLYCVEQ